MLHVGPREAAPGRKSFDIHARGDHKVSSPSSCSCIRTTDPSGQQITQRSSRISARPVHQRLERSEEVWCVRQNENRSALALKVQGAGRPIVHSIHEHETRPLMKGCQKSVRGRTKSEEPQSFGHLSAHRCSIWATWRLG